MKKRALCVGINDYPGSGNDLSGCVNDVKDWSAVLKSRGFAVKSLLDSKATKKGMVDAITNLVEDTAAGDVAVFQYSGHGSWVADSNGDEVDGRDEVLCPCDIGENVYLTDDELYDIFAKVPAGAQLIFLSDSCHSGTVAKFAPDDERDKRAIRSRLLPPGNFLKGAKLAKAMSVIENRTVRSRPHQALLISGCQDTQTSADAWFGDRPNGAFTYYALKALKGLSQAATYSDWYLKIRKYLPTATYTQKPNLYGSKTQRKWRIL